MREILISSAVCVACLLVALVSQLLAPSTVAAELTTASTAGPAGAEVALATAAAPPPPAAPYELDPDDSNPALFTMAPETNPSTETDPALAQGAEALGGEITAPRERVTESGLRITDLEEGKGAEARSGQTVSVHYRGTLENGREFDSSYGRGPFRFPLGAGRVIRGWDEGVAGMRVGGKRRLVVPPDLAYGSRGAGGVIPPDATLIFEVELLEVDG